MKEKKGKTISSGLVTLVVLNERFVVAYCLQVTPYVASFLSVIATHLQQGPLKSAKLIVLFITFHIIMGCIGLKGLNETLKYIMILN
jgi:hypothetical protein